MHRYLQFLHSLFKSEESKSFLALAYITGILPIKKIKDESALNNFDEFTMLKSKPITEYYGFTEEEVREPCEKYDMDFDTTKAWYNGYLINGKHMYNPNSFQNDLSTIASKDDTLTALIHLGYLGYDADRKKAYIPNYKVATAFEAALQVGEWKDIAKTISRCDELLFATIDGESDKVAEIIEQAHDAYTSVLKYNDENSLSYVLTMAYFTAPAYYNIIREMPACKGFADFVFIPRANAEKRYHEALSGYSEKILLVGINYDAEGNDKKHTCVIEEWNS